MIKFSFTVGFLMFCLLGTSCSEIASDSIGKTDLDTNDITKPTPTLASQSGNLAFTNLSEDSRIIAFGNSPDNLFLSEDNGNSWDKNSTIPSNYHIRTLARSAKDKEFILLSYIEDGHSYTSHAFTGLLLSRDNGKSWEELNHPFNPDDFSGNFSTFSGLAFDSDNLNIIYAVIEIGFRSVFFKSIDQGKTWNFVDLHLTGITGAELFLDPSNSNKLYVGGRGTSMSGGGFVSNDKGDTWSPWVSDSSIKPTQRIFDIDDSGVLYGHKYEGSTTSSKELLVYTSDPANSWEILYEDDSSFRLAALDTFHPGVVAILMTKSFTSENIIRYSINYGVSWTDFKLPFKYPQSLEILTFDAERLEILVSTSSTIWKVPIYYGP